MSDIWLTVLGSPFVAWFLVELSDRVIEDLETAADA